MSNPQVSAEAMSERNRAAWNAARYPSWVEAIGTPEIEAAKIRADPNHTLRRLLPHLGDVAGKRICNVQGSHGRIAVALARLGAKVTVIDFAEENRRYALELAQAAGVTIDYRLADTIEADRLGLDGAFDCLAMELGILHYHQDLERFFSVMKSLGAPNARLLLNEFHPVQRKLFWQGRGVPKDYFATALVETDVPDPTGAERSLGTCLCRFWTLGEIVGAVLAAGFTLRRLEEHPDWDDPRIPGTFTLVATA